MNGPLKVAAPLLAVLALAACNAGGSSNVPAGAGLSSGASSASLHVPLAHGKYDFCPQVDKAPSCFAMVPHKGVKPDACSPTGGTCGYRPADLEAAYNLTSAIGNGTGQIVAIIESGDLAAASTDLATYRSTFGLSTASFFKYNENGQQSGYPSSCTNFGWCLETALDMDMVSAACPNCTIDLIESDGSISGLEKSNATAVSLGATIVSNSWGCGHSWDCGDTNFGSYFDTSGIAYLASTGDSGYGVIGGPSVLSTVIGVGGTQLVKSGSTYTEHVWDDNYGAAGAGCSSTAVVGSPGVPKPSWQHDPDCTYRTDGDISAQAGLKPGVAVYASLYGGWIADVGGTSVASPFTAGVIGLAGNGPSFNGGENFWNLSKKALKADLRDIKTGDDGSCGNEYLCDAGLKKKHGGYKTYSGPAGWGTPNGIAAY